MRSATTYLLAAMVSSSCLAGAAVQDKPAAAPMAVAWQKEIEISGVRHISVGVRAIFLAGSESGLTAYALDDGRLLWQSPKATSAKTATAASLLAILTDDALEVLDQDTGQLAWRARLETGDPWAIHAAGQLFFSVRGTEIRAWRLDGTVAWRTTLTSAPATQILASADSLIVGLQAAEVVALDPATGAVRWRTALPSPPTGLSLAGDQLLIPGAAGDLSAYRLAGGLKRIWRTRRAVVAIGNPAIGERFAYVALIDNTLRAFDRKGGSQRWSSPLESRPVVGPILIGETVIVPLAAGDLAQIPAATGAKPTPAPEPTSRTSVRMDSMAASQSGLYAIVTGANGATTLVAWRAAR